MMRLSFLFLALLLFGLQQAAAQSRTSAEYKELTSENFESSIRENPYVVVVFFDSRVEGSNSIVSDLNNYRHSLTYVAENTLLGSLDVSKYPDVAEKNNANGNPDIRLFFYGIPIYYVKTDEMLKASNVHKWVIENIRKPVKDLSAERELSSWKKATARNPLQLLYVGKTTSPTFSLIKRFSSVPGTGVHVNYVLLTQTEWVEHFQIKDKNDHLYYVNSFTGQTKEYKGDLTLRDLYQFVETYKYPMFYRAVSKEPNQYADLYREKRPMLFLMVPEHLDAEDLDDYLAGILEKFAKEEVKGEVPCVFVHLKSEESETYLWKVQVKDEPTVFIVENLYNRLYHIRYKMQGEINHENLKQFYSNWKEGKLPRHYKSQELTSERDEHGILYLTRNNMKDIIYKSGKDVFVWFYSVWGANAEMNLKILTEANAFLQNSYMRKNVIVARCDATLNDIPGIIASNQRFSAFSRKSAPGEWIKGGELKTLEGVITFIEKSTTTEKPKDDL